MILPSNIASIAADAFNDCADVLKLYCYEGSLTAETLLAAGYTPTFLDPAAMDYAYELFASGEDTAMRITDYFGTATDLEVPAQIGGCLLYTSRCV